MSNSSWAGNLGTVLVLLRQTSLKGGAKRVSAAEFKRHLIIAKGSGAEAEHWLSLAADEGFARRERCVELQQDYGRLGMMIHNLWKEWRKL